MTSEHTDSSMESTAIERRKLLVAAGAAALGAALFRTTAVAAQDAVDSITVRINGQDYVIPRPPSQPDPRVIDLGTKLADPYYFQQFASDPGYVLGNAGVDIDYQLSDLLRSRLNGKASLDDLTANNCESCTTVWAVVAGIYSVASAKVAVAI